MQMDLVSGSVKDYGNLGRYFLRGSSVEPKCWIYMKSKPNSWREIRVDTWNIVTGRYDLLDELGTGRVRKNKHHLCGRESLPEQVMFCAFHSEGCGGRISLLMKRQCREPTDWEEARAMCLEPRACVVGTVVDSDKNWGSGRALFLLPNSTVWVVGRGTDSGPLRSGEAESC